MNNDNFSVSTVSVIPQDILFPEELNQYLRGQIQLLTHANGMLHKTLSERNIAIKKIFKAEHDLDKNISEINSCDNAYFVLSQKILDLNKKLKSKSTDADLWKSKYYQLQQKLKNFESSKMKEQIKNNELGKLPSVFEEVKLLQEKVNTLTNKVFDTRNINFQLKNELKLATKLLQQEIGENFINIQTLASSHSNWRGRAQQILTLKQKNAELQEKLILETSKDLGNNTNKSSEVRKQVTIEEQQKVINELKQELESTRKKNCGLKARNKVLENECATLKCKINKLTEKNDNDSEVIKLLSDQIANMEETLINIKKNNNFSVQKLNSEIKNFQFEINKHKYMEENLKKCLEQKDIKISSLEKELSETKSTALNESCSCISVINNEETITESYKIKALNAQILKLSEFIGTLNDRLNEERNAHSVTRNKYCESVQKAAQLESKLSKAEIENRIYVSQSCSRSCSKSSAGDGAKAINLSIQELENRLELAEEYISELNSKLAICQKEKEIDYKKFAAFIEELTCFCGTQDTHAE